MPPADDSECSHVIPPATCPSSDAPNADVTVSSASSIPGPSTSNLGHDSLSSAGAGGGSKPSQPMHQGSLRRRRRLLSGCGRSSSSSTDAGCCTLRAQFGALALMLAAFKLAVFLQLDRIGSGAALSGQASLTDWQLLQTLLMAAASSSTVPTSTLSSSSAFRLGDGRSGMKAASLTPADTHQNRTLDGQDLRSTVLPSSSTASAAQSSQAFDPSLPTSRTNNLWDASPVVPQWMKEYFAWHADQVRILNVTNWSDPGRKYLVMRCLLRDYKCGGASDRLKPLPFAIRLARDTHRILFVHWERPAPLEEFLVSPLGGFNWSVPHWLREKLPYKPEASIYGTHSAFKAKDVNKLLVDMRHQSHDHGSAYYNAELSAEEPSFDDVYSDVWRLVFQPSPPVAELISQLQSKLGLEPGRYASVHVRALYASDKASQLQVVENAVRCGASLMPGSPLYVASDSANVTRHAVAYGISALEGRLRVAASHPSPDAPPPLHIDRGTNFLTAEGQDWMQHNASDFYDTFVDLYVLAGGACMTYNVGGYGRWASAIGPNRTCAIDHSRHRCEWPTMAAMASGGNATMDTAAGNETHRT